MTLRETALAMADKYEPLGYIPFAQRLRAAADSDDIHGALADMLTFYRVRACPGPAAALETLLDD